MSNKLVINKLSGNQKYIFYILIITFSDGILQMLSSSLHFIVYIIDFLILFLLILLFYKNNKNRFIKCVPNNIRFLILILFLLTFIATIIHFSSPLLHLWSYRNVFRYFIFYFACITFIKEDDISFLDIIFWANFVVSLIQYFVLGYEQDCVGGLFGVARGMVNGPLNLLLVVCCVKIVIEYLNKNQKLSYSIFFIGAAIVVATVAELKVFYFEILLIIVLGSLITDFTFRKLAIILVGIFAFIAGSRFIFYIFPELNSKLFTFSFLYNYVASDGGYTGNGDINRLNYAPICLKLMSGTFNQLFGLGMGNCDVINFLGLESPFYRSYKYLNYFMFSSSMSLLEMGIIGSILYMSFYPIVYYAMQKKKNKKCSNIQIIQIGQIICILSFILLFYDTEMRGMGTFIAYYVMALPFIKKNSQKIEGE